MNTSFVSKMETDTLLTNESTNSTPSSSNILEQNCRVDWPIGVCIFANICGFTSTAIWFVNLVPQIWKNFTRRSVKGLSILWATANFTASLINLFFVFRVGKLPIYIKIEAIYQPTLEFIILLQFVIYGKDYTRGAKLIYGLVCLGFWAVVMVLELTLDIYQQIQWVAIALWCIESFPQVILNMKLRSTQGQSTCSVAISLIGKTTDFLSNYLLSMPLQFIIMTYFSSSVAYINGIQVAYYKPKYENVRQDDNMGNLASADLDPTYQQNESRGQHNDTSATPRDRSATYFNSEVSSSRNSVADESISVDDQQRLVVNDTIDRIRCIKCTCHSRFSRECFRYVIIIVLSLVLCAYAIGLIWNTQTVGALLCPAAILMVISFSFSLLRSKSLSPNTNFIAYL